MSGAWLLLVVILGLSACTASPPTPSAATAPAAQTVGVEQLKAVLDAGGGKAVVLDVRTAGEVATGHVPGALTIPLDALPGRLDELAGHRDAPLYVICAVGGRSAQAVELLAQAGFSQPINVRGGTRAWQEAGYPLD